MRRARGIADRRDGSDRGPRLEVPIHDLMRGDESGQRIPARHLTGEAPVWQILFLGHRPDPRLFDQLDAAGIR